MQRASGELELDIPSQARELGAVDSSPILSLAQLQDSRYIFINEECPSCHSKIAFYSLKCPNCESSQVAKGNVITHIPCSSTGFEESFRSNGRMQCPNCYESSQSNFSQRGVHYLCLDCSTFVDKPEVFMACTSCGYSLKSKSSLADFPSYSVPKDGALSLEPVVIAANARGWSSHAWQGLLGKSETTHEFTIVISRGKNEGNFLAIEIATSIGKVSEQTLLTFFAKSFDAGVREKILVTIPKLDDGAKKFADSYGITLIESPSPSLALEAITCKISEMSELGPKKRVMAKKEKRTSFDIIADILTTASKPISKTEILFRANLSFKQAQKYLRMLEKMTLLRCFDEGSGRRYVTTQKGAEYLADSLCDFGRISEGSNSVWSSKQENP